MKKILPALFCFFLLLSFGIFGRAYAVGDTIDITTGLPNGAWVLDRDVTFYGKAVIRSGETVNWVLKNPEWSKVTGALDTTWQQVRNVVYALFLIALLVTAFIIIVTRGQSISLLRVLPWYLGVIFLVVFSFAFVQFTYQIFDAVQRFFLVKNGQLIQSQNLLNVAFSYAEFLGYRKVGVEFDESVFASLLLVKLTTITYYLMAGVLLLRKIILWFFVIVSPIFPLLLLYAPLRSAAKIWLGEFFRWTLYAPLFAIFLSGLVSLWQLGIPLAFNGVSGGTVFPTAINILLGGPGQTVTMDSGIATPEQFGLYVVALIMLWAVVLLPFILLQIFLEYFHSVSVSETTLMKQLLTTNATLLNKTSSPLSVLPQAPGPAGAGMAKTLPFMTKLFGKETQPLALPQQQIQQNPVVQVPFATNRSSFTQTETTTTNTIPVTRQAPPVSSVTKNEFRQTATGFSSPIIQRPGTITIGGGSTRQIPLETKTFTNNTTGIARPILVQTVVEKQGGLTRSAPVQTAMNASTTILRETNLAIPKLIDIARFETSSLTKDLQRHEEVAKTHEVLERIANPTNITIPTERQQYTTLRQNLISEKQKGNPVASAVLSAATSVTNITNIEKNVTTASATTLKNQRSTTAETNVTSATVQGKPQLQSQRVTQLSHGVVSVPGKASVTFPTVNRVQQVSLEDYEQVKRMWQESYKKLDPPKDAQGKQKDRSAWISEDAAKITETVTLLSSHDEQQVKQGMSMVGNILPFLLIGGFSQTEIIAYLKAKLEAGKTTLLEVQNKEEEENTVLPAEKKKEEEKTMVAHAEIPLEEKKPTVS